MTGSIFSVLSGCPLPARYFEQKALGLSATIVDQFVLETIYSMLGIDVSGAVDTADTTGDGG